MEVWAHRGASAAYPENTMLAFTEAAKIGADAIECDVQRTRDGVLVVIHDETVNRTTNGRGYVRESSFSTIKSLDAGVKYHPRFRGERIPRLEEVLDYIKTTNMAINIEIKNDNIQFVGIEEQMIKMIDQNKMAEQVTVSSFNLISLQTVLSLAPHIETALLTSAFSKATPVLVKQMRMKAIHPSRRLVHPLFMQEALIHGIKVRPYTVNEISQMRVYQALGVAAIITDQPALAVKVVTQI